MKTVAIEHSNDRQANVFKIEWNLGKRCNFNCSYCNEYTHDNTSPHLPFETAKLTIDKILAKCSDKIIKVSLTGGEPTVNKDFEKILDYMYQNNIRVGLTTNGSRKYEYYKRNLHKLDSIIFSYHMEYHKREVIPDNVVKLFNEAKKLDKHVHIHVHMMMLPTQFEEAKSAMDLFKSNGIPVVMRRIRPAYKKESVINVYHPDGRLKSGEMAMPFYNKPVILKFTEDGQADHAAEGYYSEEELEFLTSNHV